MKCWAGWITSWNQDCQEKYQQPQICRGYHPNGRKWRGTKEPLDEGKKGEWKSWLKIHCAFYSILFLMKKEEFLARKYGNWPVFQKAHSGSSLGDWLKNIQGQAFWDIKTAFQEKDGQDFKWIGGSKRARTFGKWTDKTLWVWLLREEKSETTLWRRWWKQENKAQLSGDKYWNVSLKNSHNLKVESNSFIRWEFLGLSRRGDSISSNPAELFWGGEGGARLDRSFETQWRYSEHQKIIVN